jgi:methionine sulfoxide reductase heme-binding subunit
MKLKMPHFTPSQIAVHISAWALVAWLAWDAVTGNLTINPIQAAEQRTGRYAIYFLVLSLACTPLNTVFGFRQAITARRPLGLYAFIFAATHLFIFIGIDYGFQFSLLFADVGTKRYIIFGALAFSILLALAVTSFAWWQKHLKKNWTRLHKLIYLAGVVAVLHYAWAKKGDLFALQGDIMMPFVLGLIVLVLLSLRLPIVRRKAVNFRNRIRLSFQKRFPRQLPSTARPEKIKQSQAGD